MSHGSTSNAIVEVAELGFTVVVGILLDTFVVRPLPVPAIATILGAGTGSGRAAVSGSAVLLKARP